METDMAMRNARRIAVEHVTDGHPDKVCDQIADAILDAALEAAETPEQRAATRVAMEVTGGHGKVFITGEVKTAKPLDYPAIARGVYLDIGHDHDIEVIPHVVEQSPDIGTGVNHAADFDATDPMSAQGAGDQGVMVGYAVASPDTHHMPLGYHLARELARQLRHARLNGMAFLRPDGKSQVTMEDGQVTHVTIAAHHASGVQLDDLRNAIYDQIVVPVVGSIPRQNVVINGTGVFTIGGFEADAGTTGRKLVVDNFGPIVEIGGGCFSGKDPSKVDRSAAYFCRHVAKAIVANGLAREALVKAAFAIGVSRPTFVSIQTDLSDHHAPMLEAKVLKEFDFRPRAIIERLGLLQPTGWRYRDTAAFGHFGNDVYPWEQVAELRY